MTNQQAILTHIDHYQSLYAAQYGVNPTSWWAYTKWLARVWGAGSFTQEDIELAKAVLILEG